MSSTGGRSPSIKVGDVFPTNKAGDCEVIRYVNRNEVLVCFYNTGQEKWCRAHNLKNGEVRDTLAPTVLGVGTVGGLPVRDEGRLLPYYKSWYHMLSRCYDEGMQEKNQTYKGCTVTKDWLYLPNFKKWHDQYYRKGFDLDKDILVRGNKVYSPYTCEYIPQELNKLLVFNDKSRGNCTVGVCFIELTGKYLAHVCRGTGSRYIGSYHTEEEAFLSYKQEKELFIKEQAHHYLNKGDITQRMFDALIKFEITPDI